MKKVLLIAAAAVAVSLTGCDNTPNYKAQGEQMAKELDRLVEQQDAAAVLAFEDSINNVEAQIVEKGDSLGVEQFRDALTEARKRNAPYIATLKVKNGANKDDVVEEMKQEVLNGSIDIATVTETIDKLNETAK